MYIFGSFSNKLACWNSRWWTYVQQQIYRYSRTLNSFTLSCDVALMLLTNTCFFIVRFVSALVSMRSWSGSSFLLQCGSGSREPNQFGSESGLWSDFFVTKSWILHGKISLCGQYIGTLVKKFFWKAGNQVYLLIFLLLDLELHSRFQIQESQINADPCGSGSTARLYLC